MPAVPTTGSPDIVSLDSKLTADLCDGDFYVDVSHLYLLQVEKMMCKEQVYKLLIQLEW